VNIKEYISSGVIESYVLGIATEAERAEFEAMCQQHPEVVQARIQFEMLLESKLLQEAIPPPENTKEKLLGLLTTSDTPNTTDNPIKDEVPVRRLSIWKIIAAASILLLAGTAFWAYTVKNENSEWRQKYEAEVESRKRDSAQYHNAHQVESEIAVMQKSSIKMAALLNTSTATQCMAHVYWDTTSKDTYILVNNLPKPASDKQYQLWALLNGQPIDLGVFDIRKESLLVQTKNTQNAQAFAITLEPKGGSPTPTMTAMSAISKSL
jgi:anti-sigma-K factor RskA